MPAAEHVQPTQNQKAVSLYLTVSVCRDRWVHQDVHVPWDVMLALISSWIRFLANTRVCRVLLELTRLISEWVPARKVMKENLAKRQAVWQNPNVCRVLPCNFRALVRMSVETAP